MKPWSNTLIICKWNWFTGLEITDLRPMFRAIMGAYGPAIKMMLTKDPPLLRVIHERSDCEN
jgi:hypothetical protein